MDNPQTTPGTSGSMVVPPTPPPAPPVMQAAPIAPIAPPANSDLSEDAADSTSDAETEELLNSLSPLRVLARQPLSAANTQASERREDILAASQVRTSETNVTPPVISGGVIAASVPPLDVVEPVEEMPLKRLPANPPAPAQQITLPQEAVAARFERALTKRGPNKALIALIAILGVFVLGIGGAVAAVYVQGTRLPVLYTMISGLPSSWNEQRAQLITSLESQDRYLADVTTTIRLTKQAEGADEEVAGAVLALGVYDSPNTSLEVNAKNGNFIGTYQIAVNPPETRPEAAFRLSVNASPGVLSEFSDNWVVYVPAAAEAESQTSQENTQDTTAASEEEAAESSEPIHINPEDLSRTLLWSVISHRPVRALLQGASNEVGYAKVSGMQMAAYSTKLEDAALSAALPRGATAKNATMQVFVPWGSSLPSAYRVTATVTYLGAEYSYRQEVSLRGWGERLDTSSDTALRTITGSINADDVVEGDSELLASQLGILSLDSLPNTFDDEFDGGTGSESGGDDITPLPSASPSPSASPTATPSPSPTSSPAALVPSGLSTPVVTSALSTNPPVPSQIITEASRTQDAQRLRDITMISAALTTYARQSGSYPIATVPVQIQSYQPLFTALVPSLLTAMPIDPLPNTYWYEYQSNGRTATIRAVAFNRNDSDVKQGVVYPYRELVLPSL